MKKLYLISYYFAPLGRADGINRTYLAKYLAELGWGIDVISCKNPHAFMRNFQKDYSLLDILPSNIKLHQIQSTYWGPIGGLAALAGLADDPFWNWYHPVLQEVDSIVKEQGLIYAIAPPPINAKIAAKIANTTGFPLIIDFRDDNFRIPPNLVKQAVSIIASTENSLENMRNFYNLNRNLGETIYNGYAVDTPLAMTTQPKPSDKLNIIYTGLLNLDQDPVMLVRAIKFMEEKYPETKNAVSVDYYGPKNYYTRLFLRKYLSENIRFRGYVPFNIVLEKIAQADLAYLGLKNETKAYCIPSKTFQYISMETPILATGPKGAMEDFIIENKIGRFSLSTDIEGQADDIYHFLTNKQARVKALKHLQDIKPQLSMRFQAQRLDKHLSQLL